MFFVDGTKAKKSTDSERAFIYIDQIGRTLLAHATESESFLHQDPAVAEKQAQFCRLLSVKEQEDQKLERHGESKLESSEYLSMRGGDLVKWSKTKSAFVFRTSEHSIQVEFTDDRNLSILLLGNGETCVINNGRQQQVRDILSRDDNPKEKEALIYISAVLERYKRDKTK